MFTLYHSNQLDVLKDLLVELIRRDPLSNPLEDEQILVQSPGMAQWLRLSLAETLGIAAAIEFPLPASFLWDMFVRVLPGVPKRSAFNKEAMTWKLVSLLPDMLKQDSFTPLRQYLDDDHDGVRLFQLAGKIADTFDQYLVYRPDWIASWEKGEDPDNIAIEQPWQPELWRSLVQKNHEAGQSHWHRANMHNRFLEELHNGAHQHRLPKRLFVFGISALPPHFVETLNALGQQTEVHLLVCNPCRYYWGDEKDPRYLARLTTRRFAKSQVAQSLNVISQKSQTGFTHEGLSLNDPNAPGNPLLGSMGKLGRDYLHQLHGLEAPDISAFVDGSETCLLHAIQNDILELKTGAGDREIQPDDQSLVLHSCHSPLREVEVLHDQLLALFEQHPDLTPKDVVVMLPDVDQYSPWIQAVFGGIGAGRRNGQVDSRRIPFSISDLSARDEHPVLSGLLHLLDLDNSRCSAPELLELLDIKALQQRFDFSAEDIDIVRQWVNDTGIRWGLSPEHQQHFDLPPRDSNSWLFGLRRMLLGYAMPEACGLYDNILPFDAIQGMSSRLAGQLAEFVDQADHLTRTLQQDRSITEWMAYIHNLTEHFFDPGEQDQLALKLVYDALENLQQQLQDAGYDAPLSRPVLLDYLTERLTSQRGSQRFLAGQVNFCTLMPMRSIPFKVVCLLGLNDGAYPRSIAPTGFDLIAQHTQRGDRSRREDDRYLFLEALLSARKKLYISYVGKSIKDNTERVPSVLVTELLDYCQQGFSVPGKKLREHLVTEHPLQPFSPGNFTPSSDLFSYAREWLPAAQREGTSNTAFITGELPAEKEKQDTVELGELLRFYRNPSKAFCNRRLKVYFEEAEETLAETEPFMIDGLDAYQLKQAILEHLLETGNTTELQKILKATGSLPHGAFGELLLEEQEEELTELADSIRQLTSNKNKDTEVNLAFASPGLKLTGWLKNIYSQRLVRFRPTKIKGKDILLTWIEHLCHCTCADTPSETYLLGLGNSMKFLVVSEEEAFNQLEAFMREYQNGQRQPLPLFVQTCWAWLQQDSEEKARKEAFSAFDGAFKLRGEKQDAYIQRCHPELEPVFEAMIDLTEELMQPLCQYLEEVK